MNLKKLQHEGEIGYLGLEGIQACGMICAV
jgi:hypothetical protein